MATLRRCMKNAKAAIKRKAKSFQITPIKSDKTFEAFLGRCVAQKPDAFAYYAGRFRELDEAISREIGKAVEFVNASHSLETLNEWIRRIGVFHDLIEQPSVTKAKAELRRAVHINIYDLMDGNYDKAFKDFREFQDYTVKNGLFFPRKKAKEGGLKVFLRKLF